MNELLLEATASEETATEPEATTVDYSSKPTGFLETSLINHSRRAAELKGSEDPMDKVDFDHATKHVELITSELDTREGETSTDFSHENIDSLVDDAQELAVPESSVVGTSENTPVQPELEAQPEVTAEQLKQAEDAMHEALSATQSEYSVFEKASDAYIELLEKAKDTNTPSAE